MIALGSDHAGLPLKKEIIALLEEMNIPYHDYGTYTSDSCDYAMFAQRAAKAVVSGECERGILCCGTGIGISIAANKVKGIRCALCADPLSAALTRRHNNANIIVFPARFITNDEAVAMLDAYFAAQFEGGRHQHRIEKMAVPCGVAAEK